MKYLKRFNESEESGLDQSDLNDIEDLFKEVADKNLIKKIDLKPGQDIIRVMGSDDEYANKYYIHFGGDEIVIDIRLAAFQFPDNELRYSNSSPNGDRSKWWVPDPKVVDDIILFCERLRQIGYKVNTTHDGGDNKESDFLYQHTSFDIRISN